MDVKFWNLSHDKLYELQNSGRLDNGTIIVCPDVERLYIKLGDKLMPMTPSRKARHIEYKPRKCVCCGAPLTDMNRFVVKCEYCGTIYDVDEGEEI